MKHHNAWTIKVVEHHNAWTLNVVEHHNAWTINVVEHHNAWTINVMEHHNAWTVNVVEHHNAWTIKVLEHHNGWTINVVEHRNGWTINEPQSADPHLAKALEGSYIGIRRKQPQSDVVEESRVPEVCLLEFMYGNPRGTLQTLFLTIRRPIRKQHCRRPVFMWFFPRIVA